MMGRMTAYDLSDFDKSDYDFLCRYGRTPEEVMEENTKLRELVKHLRECTRHNTCAVCVCV